jgi:propionyl-CoA synthetase
MHQTETGFPITSTCLCSGENKTIKFGTSGKPVPGSTVVIMDEKTGYEVGAANTFGPIVLKPPLPPAFVPYLWNHDPSFTNYFTKYPGYYDTGDAGMLDDEG